MIGQAPADPVAEQVDTAERWRAVAVALAGLSGPDRQALSAALAAGPVDARQLALDSWLAAEQAIDSMFPRPLPSTLAALEARREFVRASARASAMQAAALRCRDTWTITAAMRRAALLVDSAARRARAVLERAWFGCVRESHPGADTNMPAKRGARYG